MSDLLKLEKRGHTAIITFNNPPANTWTPESLAYLKQLVEDLNADKDNYALVLASESEKFFSAGADLKQFDHDDKGKSFASAQAFGDAFMALTNYNGVSIAAITGYAMGGGLEVALCCDVRICEEQSQMALPEAAVGLLPCGLGSQHLSWLVGEQWAKRMILLGERLKAPQAEKIGLVSEVVPTGTALEKALELAAKVEGQSPTSVRYCKELIMAARDGDINSAFYKERELFVKLWDSQDQKEGVSAFLEKRKPEWKNA
ncbi:enoyl-CoA hydratase [Pseudomaricurvus sp. HS19]|uniref:enoyl-CoA hydratase n=1 Tax=Pseudomaricurvus sp. HS19 TaxID=2692626 RepID=UPI00136B3A29|nr:enoyl-CoA hydratase [Pseudomaricurvus sp. HS19]MYM64295.1 enoyl-CoA hydratase [Pseudomaricurvus sp. HS19]